jgi:hypothetical protein
MIVVGFINFIHFIYLYIFIHIIQHFNKEQFYLYLLYLKFVVLLNISLLFQVQVECNSSTQRTCKKKHSILFKFIKLNRKWRIVMKKMETIRY